MMILLKKSVASFNERIYMFFETRDQMVFMIMPRGGQMMLRSTTGPYGRGCMRGDSLGRVVGMLA